MHHQAYEEDIHAHKVVGLSVEGLIHYKLRQTMLFLWGL